MEIVLLPLKAMGAIFIATPILAIFPTILYLWLFTVSRRPFVLATSLMWLAYLCYESAIKLRILCSGECNIRVDLLLMYPTLLLVSVVAVISVFLKKDNPAEQLSEVPQKRGATYLLKKIATALCVVMLAVAFPRIVQTAFLALAQILKPMLPAAFYGISLVAFLRPGIKPLTIAALGVGLVFLGLGMYGMFVVLRSDAYSPLQPLLLVVFPCLFVVSSLVAQFRSRLSDVKA